MKKLCEDYDQQLKYLFEYFVKQDLEELAKASEQLLSYKAFVIFTNLMKLIPEYLSPDDASMMFKAMIREKNEKLKGKEAVACLGYEDFLEALVRIVAAKNNRLADTETESKSKSKVGQKRALLLNMKGVTTEIVEKLFLYMNLEAGEKKASLVQRLIELKHDYSKVPTLKTKNPSECK